MTTYRYAIIQGKHEYLAEEIDASMSKQFVHAKNVVHAAIERGIYKCNAYGGEVVRFKEMKFIGDCQVGELEKPVVVD